MYTWVVHSRHIKSWSIYKSSTCDIPYIVRRTLKSLWTCCKPHKINKSLYQKIPYRFSLNKGGFFFNQSNQLYATLHEVIHERMGLRFLFTGLSKYQFQAMAVAQIILIRKLGNVFKSTSIKLVMYRLFKPSTKYYKRNMVLYDCF